MVRVPEMSNVHEKGELIDVCGLHYKAAAIIAENSVQTKDRMKV